MKYILSICAALLLLAALFLLGSLLGGEVAPPSLSQSQEIQISEEESATVPADGNPGDVTALGSYSRSGDPTAVIATIGEERLTNRSLNIWYWATVAQYRQQGQPDTAPDFSRPLDSQSCPVEGFHSWQQYFLSRALTAWQQAAALQADSLVTPWPVDAAYQPDEEKHAHYMTGMPAAELLYGYDRMFRPNSADRSYLDALPGTLDALAKNLGYEGLDAMAKEAFAATGEDVAQFARLYNYAYFYYLEKSYHLEQPEKEAAAVPGRDKAVDLRLILLEGKEREETAERIRKDYENSRPKTEFAFADLAYNNSRDAGSVKNGGLYRRILPGQLPEILDKWCFDDARRVADVEILEDGQRTYLVYFIQSQKISELKEEQDAKAAALAAMVQEVTAQYPMNPDYTAIALEEATGRVSLSQLLYGDIAHERFPEVPLYLQQDYPQTMFGGWPIRTNGCGITSLAMLASYMADEALLPSEMCARYGNRYSFSNGTDGTIFVKEVSGLGFYFQHLTYNPEEALAALKDGHIVVSIQHKGYWTRGGHYLVLEKYNEDGSIQVRDSNLYNYGLEHPRVPRHAQDNHSWASITSAGSGYWIFDYKIKTIPLCSRCGDNKNRLITGDYLCEKCETATIRRSSFLGN